MQHNTIINNKNIIINNNDNNITNNININVQNNINLIPYDKIGYDYIPEKIVKRLFSIPGQADSY